MKGLLIKGKYDINIFNYSIGEWDRDNMEHYFINKGFGEYQLLETFDGQNGLYLVFGFRHGYNNFNSFDLMSCTSYGDIIICKVDNDIVLNPIDIDIQEIKNFYTYYEIINSESDSSIGDYDLNDPFIASSDEEGMEVD
jgi:hypothetical protein